MNYEIIKIEGNIAYILEKVSGKVIKTLIEDRTQGYGEPIEIVYDHPVPKRMPILENNFPSYAPRHIGNEEYKPTGIVPEAFKEAVRQNQTVLPDKPAYAPPPAGLAGVMIEQEQPGAAVETRRV